MIEEAKVVDETRLPTRAELEQKKFRFDYVTSEDFGTPGGNETPGGTPIELRLVNKTEILAFDKLPKAIQERLLSTVPEPYFRAHSSGNLLVGGNEITEKQEEKLIQLHERDVAYVEDKARVEREGTRIALRLGEIEHRLGEIQQAVASDKDSETAITSEETIRELMGEAKALQTEEKDLQKKAKALKVKARPLTPNMIKEFEELLEKKFAPFQFGKTSLAYIRKTYRRNEYGFDEPIASKEMLKGLRCEQDAIRLVSEVIPSPKFRRKNTTNFHDVDGYFTGTPDVILWPFVEYAVDVHEGEDPEIIRSFPGVVEDVKTSWNLRTFDEVETPPEGYITQAQIYMYLTGIKFYRLIYCLVDTPDDLIEEEKKKFFFKYGSEDSPQYIEAAHKLDLVHKVSPKIPKEDRVKVFEFEYDSSYIEKLKERVDLAREVYHSLRLVPDHLRPSPTFLQEPIEAEIVDEEE